MKDIPIRHLSMKPAKINIDRSTRQFLEEATPENGRNYNAKQRALRRLRRKRKKAKKRDVKERIMAGNIKGLKRQAEIRKELALTKPII